MKLIRTLVSRSVITGAVVLGLMAQAGAYLLAFTENPSAPPVMEAAEAAAYATPGPYPTGVRWLTDDAETVDLTVWYPAMVSEDEGSLSYGYGLNMFGPSTVTALAVDAGRAQPSALPETSGGPFPLVVFSHGFAIPAASYAWIAEHLASHGMVVVAPHHDESLDPRSLWKSTVDRPFDIDAVMSMMMRGLGSAEFDGLVDLESVAVVGHSYGGYTALEAAGARLDSEAFEMICDSDSADSLDFLCNALSPRLDDLAERAGLETSPSGLWPRFSSQTIDAAISMAGDAAMFGEDGLAEVEIPVMLIGGTADVDAPFEWGTEFPYEHVSSERRVEIGLEGAGHFVFAGGCGTARRILTLVQMGFCSDPAWDRDTAHGLVKHYVAAFLLAELRGDPTARAALGRAAQQFPDVGFRSEGY